MKNSVASSPVSGQATRLVRGPERRRIAGVLVGGLLAVVHLTLLAANPEAASDAAPLTERFTCPPASCRVLKIIHGWPDEPARQDELRARLLAQGFGGVVCNVSFNDYLQSPAKWQAFVRAVTEARRAGMSLWLYDERGYPSGSAGGQVLQGHPEWEATGLLIADTESGPGALKLTVPPGRLRRAVAFPLANGVAQWDGQIDLTARVAQGLLTWNAPAVRWHGLAITECRLYDGTHAELNLHEKLPYPNLLLAAPTARFLELTHERYARELGADLGQSFVATFTDEPSLMSEFLRRMPYRPLPWSPSLATEFRQRRGYALEPNLPALVVGAGPRSARTRHDFWLTIGELVAENYFGQIQRWCDRHRIPSGGHLLAEENLANHVALYGDFFRCVRRLDASSIDCLTSFPPDVPWYIARLVASAAELEGKLLVMCETSDHAQVWRPAGDTRPRRVVTEAEIRGTCNRLMVAGINTITSYYSFADLSDDALRRINEWVGRCATMLRGGHQVADLAVVYPAESLWTRFVPSPHWALAASGANRIDQLWRDALEGLFAGRRDFTVIDSRTLREAKVEQGTLVHGALRWRVVVLPGVDTLPLAAWRKLAQFVRSGGLVIDLGAEPVNSEREFPCAEALNLAREWRGRDRDRWQANRAGGAGIILSAGMSAALPALLESRLEPDVGLVGQGTALRATHREIDGHSVYFLINDSAQPWHGEITLRARGPFERWDPATGSVTSLGDGPRLPLALEPYGAAIVRCGASRPPVAHALGKGSVLPGLSTELLPTTTPTLAHGEFVRGELLPIGADAGSFTGSPDDKAVVTPGDHDAARGRSAGFNRPGVANRTVLPDKSGVPGWGFMQRWRARATLTRGQVDTFLFVRFILPQPIDLSDADGIIVDSAVPADQRTPTSLLVILHEEGGGDFLANTSRQLGRPGEERAYVPWTRFQLAGWSTDADGVLDLHRVGEVRVGWGGYLGEENEQIEFTLAVPRCGAISITPPRHTKTEPRP
jgi:hypothetical protein